MLTMIMTALLTLATSNSTALSAPAPRLDQPVEVHFVRDDSRSGRARVEILLHRTDINEVVVEALDENGDTLGTYALHPWENGNFRALMNLQFGAAVDAHVSAASVTGFTVRSTAAKTQQFKLLLDEAQRVTGCAGSPDCSPTRLECNNLCGAMSCASASYSCQDNGAGCEATCTCLGCP